MKKKILQTLASVVMIVCLCFGLAACNSDKNKTAFATPSNVQITGDTLTWDAVEDAVSYTVKINTDETQQVSTNSLNLTTVTSKLVSGENTLSVKVNATEDKLESAYSSTVKYTYTPSTVTPEKTAFATPANLKVEGDTLSWDAVEGAASYTVKINTDETQQVSTNSLNLTTVTSKLVSGENTLSVKVNATDDKLESAYSSTVKYTYTPPAQYLETPTVALNGSTLSWNEISGATQGYTVKIGTQEIVVNSASLDLTSAEATALLVRGENTISVKANATTEKEASDYSAPVTYTYVIAAADEAEEFIAAVENIGTVSLQSENVISIAKTKYGALSEDALDIDGVSEAINQLTAADCTYFELLAGEAQTVTENSTKSEIEAADLAITAALNYYDTLIDESSVSSVKAALDTKQSAYTSLISDINTQIGALKTALEAAEATATAKESATDLQSRTNSAKEAKEAISLAAQSYKAEDYANYTARLTQVEATLNEWNTEIDQAKEALTYTFKTIETDADGEANYAKATQLLEVYENYETYVKNAVTEQYDTITQAKSAAQSHIQSSVSALAQRVAGLDGQTLSKAYYDTLTALNEDIQALGSYASQIWNSTDTQKVESEIIRVETTVYNSDTALEVFIDGANGTVTLLYTATNVLGNNIEMSDLALEITLQAGATVDTSEAKFELNNGIYIYSVGFVKNADAESDALTVTYKIGDEESRTATYKEFKDDIYFLDGNGFNAVVDDKIQYSGAPGDEAYIDIYTTDAITLDENGGLPQISGFPLVERVPVTNGMTLEALRVWLAGEYPELIDEEYEVRFVVYRLTEDEDTGAITISNIKNALVSHDTYTLNLTAEDTKARLPFGNAGLVVGSDGSVICGAALDFDALIQLFNDDAITNTAELIDANLVQFIVVVTRGNETHSFYAPLTGNGSISNSLVVSNIADLFDGTDGTFYLQFGLVLTENGEELYGETVRSSDITPVNSERYYTFPTGEPLPSHLVNDRWTLGNDENIDYAWEAINNNQPYTDTLTITAYLVEEGIDAQTYDFVNEAQPFAVYTYTTTSAGWIKWSDINAAIISDWNGYDNVGNTATFVFVMQIIVNDAGAALGMTDSEPIYATLTTGADDNTRATKTITRGLSLPTGNQMGFAGTVLVFMTTDLDGNTTRGAVMANGDTYIVVKFVVDGTERLAYLYAEEGGYLKLYANADKSGNALSCDTVTNGWANSGDFNNWAIGAYDDIEEGFDILTNGCAFSTKIVSDGTGYYAEGETDFSEAVTYQA